MIATLAATLIAYITALIIGIIFGNASKHSSFLAAVGHYLTEARVALLPIFLAAVLLALVSWPHFLLIGCVTGIFQALATNRWIVQRREDWNPALLSRVTLGRSATTLIAQRARSRGAVVATLATSTLQVVMLEALLNALKLGNERSLGAQLVHGTSWGLISEVAFIAGLMIALELIASSILQPRQRR